MSDLKFDCPSDCDGCRCDVMRMPPCSHCTERADGQGYVNDNDTQHRIFRDIEYNFEVPK